MYCERQLRAPLMYSPRCILVGYLCPQWTNESCLGNRFNRVCKRPRCSTAGSRSTTVQTMGDKHLEKKIPLSSLHLQFSEIQGLQVPAQIGKKASLQSLKELCIQVAVIDAPVPPATNQIRPSQAAALYRPINARPSRKHLTVE